MPHVSKTSEIEITKTRGAGLIVFTTSDFLWDSDNKAFAAKMSGLGINEIGRIGFEITDDKFILCSAETDVEMIMALDVINRNHEDDIESWTYRPESDEHNFTVTIHND